MAIGDKKESSPSSSSCLAAPLTASRLGQGRRRREVAQCPSSDGARDARLTPSPRPLPTWIARVQHSGGARLRSRLAPPAKGAGSAATSGGLSLGWHLGRRRRGGLQRRGRRRPRRWQVNADGGQRGAHFQKKGRRLTICRGHKLCCIASKLTNIPKV